MKDDLDIRKLVEKLNIKDLYERVADLRASKADLDFYLKFHALLDDFEASIETNRHKIKSSADKEKLALIENEIEEIRRGITILESEERGRYLN
jgi:hypothetical protein